MSSALVPCPTVFPVRWVAASPKGAKRVFQFFTTQINNGHTRKAYLNATRRSAQWCEAHGIRELAAVEPSHVAAFINELQDQDRHPNTQYEFRLKTGSYIAAASFFHAPGSTQ
jgi:hypothetical protein